MAGLFAIPREKSNSKSSAGGVKRDNPCQEEDQHKTAIVSQNRNVMTLNISGEVFEIGRDKVNRWPNTLLGHKDVERYYNKELGMYFFDRNRAVFEYVIRFYQSEEVIDFPERYPSDLVTLELDFFRIGWRDLHKGRDCPMQYEGRRERCYAFFNDHTYSQGAKIYMIVELGFIVVSILHFILETDYYIHRAIQTNPTLFLCISALTYICTIFFTLDFILRFVSSLDHRRFFIESTTWLDILALIPFFIDIYVLNLSYEEGTDQAIALQKPELEGAWKFFDVLRIARVARCFKIIRRSERLRIIIVIIVDCMSELSVMLFAWIIGIIMSGSVGYYAETTISEMFYNKSNPQFSSILESSWWAQITMSTIGYGDISPVYSPGMVVATVIIFGSSVFTAIPMTIIIRRFSEEYEKMSSEERPRKVLGNEGAEGQPPISEVIQRYRDEKGVRNRAKTDNGSAKAK